MPSPNPQDMSPEEMMLFALSQVVQPSQLTPQAFLAAAVTLFVATAAFVAIRLWSNFKHIKIHVDDYLCVVALICLFWNAATFYVLISVLNKDPKDVTINWINTLAYSQATAHCIRQSSPPLFLYIRTFGVERWLRRTCHFLAIMGFVGFISTATYTSVECSPQRHEETPLFLFSCITAVTNGCIARASVSMAMDVPMFVLPIPVIWKLHMPLRRKIGLAMVFVVGIFAIAASALGLYFQKAQTGGSSSNFANALLVTVLESAIVIIVSCTPAIHLLWTREAGAVRARLGLSRLSTKNTGSRQEDFGSHSSGHRPKNHSGSIQVTTNHYIELGDMPNDPEPRSTAHVSAPHRYR
ncbi:unnamed protein product [Clonostachys chloroleuca]|uniref:Rhodopsin domain-containing protein n=1 Tax=Clonostachys chloroleuca TaxID=1926264 RepID=A0AA35PUK8_9HYPO|nr:unnamed protein product [Clonostachys chloroleuca]